MPSTPKQRAAFFPCAALSLIAAFAPSASAQTPSHPQPLEFEVTTIKPVDPHSSSIETDTDITPNGIVNLKGLSLKTMIEEAFNVSYWQIQGGEPWMEKTLYDVMGKPPDNIRQSRPDTRHTWYTIADPRLREMLQNLLIERFQLKIHRSTQTGKVYFLERTAKPLALLPKKTVPPDPSSPADPTPPKSTYGEITFNGLSRSGDSQLAAWFLSDATMPELANFASSYMLHRPVYDRTSLTGAFDYRSEPEDWNAAQADQGASFLRMLKQVGLKLEPATGPAEILIIDHAELPSPN